LRPQRQSLRPFSCADFKTSDSGCLSIWFGFGKWRASAAAGRLTGDGTG
jgi:hypothetical protein